MIRLIATDMDGTLLNSQKEFDQEFFKVLQKLLDKGIYFVVASGNQFHHLYNQFLPYSDQLYFISENGSYITKGRQELSSFIMKQEDVLAVYTILQEYPELMVVMGGKERSYILEKYCNYQEEIEKHYDEYAFIHDLSDIHEGILKFSLHDPKHHVERYVDSIREQLPFYLHIMTSGNEWMDIQHEMIHKGFGMKFLIDSLGLSRDECAAFGDQMNDYELLQSVKYSYAMGNAVEVIKEISYQVIQSNDEAGVTFKIKELLGNQKILFSDFDGTLFFKDGFHQEDIKAIQEFQNKGNKFALCTGRPLGGVRALLKGLLEPDYYVLCTGGLVLNKELKVIYKEPIPFDIVKKVSEQYQKETIIGPHCLDKDYLYFAHVFDDMPSYIKSFDSIDEFKEKEIYSVSLIKSSRAKEITDEINEQYPLLEAFQNVNAIDIVKRGCSKGTGIQQIKNLIDDETAGIGDSFNDLDMFKVVDQSFTFKSSPMSIQEKTDHVVSSIKEAIEILEEE